ncbi:beta-N-acetylglucosaminidase domain-containing protein [Mucilaginibacter sp. JRF]|uniref:beta-N-acetylhexosaminidase family protein n=1 Tax=Mucilaginibacter sp. JRF TaxID=2780088 RepID=UPI001882CBF8|nr:beta-N-acetylglucosaminidase domain-containing protein [Mucilaginibacter sp. JRF]MBE9585699.1 beta-N-acetylglucosaminidase domain-containing protein [Mucilaginibacter sp. JRF]
MNKLFTCVALLMLGVGTSFAQMGQTPGAPVTLPMLFPTPQSIELGKGAMVLGRSTTLIIAPGTETGTVDLVRAALRLAGVKTITTAQKLPSVTDGIYVVIGTVKSAAVNDALKQSGTAIDNHTEGYTITSIAKGNGGIITLAGHDADGLFHAVQTLRQLVQRSVIPALVIQDHPAMPIRGTIEGFYGAPWTMENRSKHLDFLAGVKANTYVYSPKDDPYARDRWREDYPKNTLAELGKLVATAQRNHINFVYAVSPGPTVCFSDPAELKLIERKFEALRSIGVHNFYVALDDIEYTKWNCDKDKAAFGEPGAEAAGVAQAKFLNAVQASLNAHDPKAQPLIMVPTEYYDAKESPYKASLRKHLDPKIVVQWTGTDVVPPAIATTDAQAATKAFGRKTLLWDNYPVNDYAQTTGRLLLAPYTRREAGLAEGLSGILSNPMNQEAASRPAVTGVVAFAWNDKAYDANRTWHFSARELAGGDQRTTAALLTFFDTQHIAPTFGNQPWQEQAPRLKATLDAVREAIAGGDAATRKQAIANLVKCADDLAAASDVIRSGVVDPAFAQEARPWLDALQLWGRALQLTAAGLNAADQSSPAAIRYFATAKKLAAEAAAIQSIKGATRFDGPIKIADGVLDTFVADAPKLIAVE